MSIQAMTWAWEQAELTGNKLSVLVALANFADADGSCFPGIETLRSMVHLSKTTVVKIIQELERDGYLSKARRVDEFGHRTSNKYWLTIDGPKSTLAELREAESLSTDSDIPKTSSGMSKVKTAGLTRNQRIEPKNRTKDMDPDVEDSFEVVWKAWPKKADRADAFRKFQSTVKSQFKGDPDYLVSRMLEHAEAYRKFRPDVTFVPSVARWLNAQRWNEKAITGPERATNQSRTQAVLDRYGVSLTDADFLALG